MIREYGLSAVKRDSHAVVTVGSFDGVHAGHQAILAHVIGRARAQGACSTLVTFEPHPRQVLTGKALPVLTTVEEKVAILEALGLDRLIILEFTRTFAGMEPEQYVRDILVGRIGLCAIAVGHDHGFGRGRQGDAALLRRMGLELGFAVAVVPPKRVGSRVVSSRAIRQLITEAGDVASAGVMLTRAYSIAGTVVRGAGRGRTIGVPTANLKVQDTEKVLPRCGVYVVHVLVCGETFGGMMNIGYRPTVEREGPLHLEVHLFDFSGDLYGEQVAVRFLRRLRDEQAFASVQALKAQLSRDALESRALLTHMEPMAESTVSTG